MHRLRFVRTAVGVRATARGADDADAGERFEGEFGEPYPSWGAPPGEVDDATEAGRR